jgi:hypothetical protein
MLISLNDTRNSSTTGHKTKTKISSVAGPIQGRDLKLEPFLNTLVDKFFLLPASNKSYEPL